MMPADMTTNPAEQTVSLPTLPVLAVTWWSCALAGVVAALGVILFAAVSKHFVEVVLGAVTVAGVSSITLLALRPWRPKSLFHWPILWMASHFLRLVLTPAAGLLLYSATPYGGLWFWIAVLLAYLAMLAGETRVYAHTMNRLRPAGSGDSDRSSS